CSSETPATRPEEPCGNGTRRATACVTMGEQPTRRADRAPGRCRARSMCNAASRVFTRQGSAGHHCRHFLAVALEEHPGVSVVSLGIQLEENREDGGEKEQLVQNAADEASTTGNWVNRTHHEEDVNNKPEKKTLLLSYISHISCSYSRPASRGTTTSAPRRPRA